MILKRKIIRMPRQKLLQLAEAHGVSDTMVYNALAGRSDSELAQLLRKEAEQLYGGVQTTKIIFQQQ